MINSSVDCYTQRPLVSLAEENKKNGLQFYIYVRDEVSNSIYDATYFFYNEFLHNQSTYKIYAVTLMNFNGDFNKCDQQEVTVLFNTLGVNIADAFNVSKRNGLPLEKQEFCEANLEIVRFLKNELGNEISEDQRELFLGVITKIEATMIHFLNDNSSDEPYYGSLRYIFSTPPRIHSPTCKKRLQF